MNVKRALILTPLILLALLLQSYFWVPSYEKQSIGNPARLRTYIEGSIADAKILNPILNADGASSRITDFVFDGLLDMDENLTCAAGWRRTGRLPKKPICLPGPR